MAYVVILWNHSALTSISKVVLEVLFSGLNGSVIL